MTMLFGELVGAVSIPDRRGKRDVETALGIAFIRNNEAISANRLLLSIVSFRSERSGWQSFLIIKAEYRVISPCVSDLRRIRYVGI